MFGERFTAVDAKGYLFLSLIEIKFFVIRTSHEGCDVRRHHWCRCERSFLFLIGEILTFCYWVV